MVDLNQQDRKHWVDFVKEAIVGFKNVYLSGKHVIMHIEDNNYEDRMYIEYDFLRYFSIKEVEDIMNLV